MKVGIDRMSCRLINWRLHKHYQLVKDMETRDGCNQDTSVTFLIFLKITAKARGVKLYLKKKIGFYLCWCKRVHVGVGYYNVLQISTFTSTRASVQNRERFWQ